MTGRKKRSTAPEFPYANIAECPCETEEESQKLVDQFLAAGGTGEQLAAQLNEAFERNDSYAVLFNHAFLPILREIPDFSDCSAAVVTYAVENRACCVLELLLERGADVNARAEESAALLVAAQFHDEESALGYGADLIAAGADLDITCPNGETALMHAAAQGHAEFVRCLIAAGADVTRRDAEGRTALHWALGNEVKLGRECVEAARALLEAGAPVDALDFNRQTAMHHLALAADGLGASDAAAAIDLLRRHGADIEARNHERHTPVLLASENGGRGGFLLELLHRAGANLDVKVNGKVVIDEMASDEGPKRALRSIRMGQRLDAAMSDDGVRRSPSKRKAREISPL